MLKTLTFVTLCCGILFIEGKYASSFVPSHKDSMVVPSRIISDADFQIDPVADEQYVADLSARIAREAQMNPFNPSEMANMAQNAASQFADKAMNMAGQIAEKFKNPSDMMNFGSMMPTK